MSTTDAANTPGVTRQGPPEPLHGRTLESEPIDMPWGGRAFRLQDRDGFGIVISSGR